MEEMENGQRSSGIRLFEGSASRINTQGPQAETEARGERASESTKKSISKRKSKKQATTTVRFSWTPELIELLLKLTKEYTAKCEFKGIDFEADLASQYTEIRSVLAADYPMLFGPKDLTEPTIELASMNSDEYNKLCDGRQEEQNSIKRGYERVREKIKGIRHNFRDALVKGTRSGSGRIVQEHFDLLGEIWGGSPAATSLSFGLDGDTFGPLTDDDDELGSEQFDNRSETEGGTPLNDSTSSSLEDHARPSSRGSMSSNLSCGKAPKRPAPIPKLVDNKRRHMEKSLSQAQRDQILLNSAKEDAIMKRDMIAAFEQSNKSLDESISEMTTCLSAMSEGLTSGIKLMAQALAQPAPPPHYPPHLNYMNTSSSYCPPGMVPPQYWNPQGHSAGPLDQMSGHQSHPQHQQVNDRESPFSGPLSAANHTMYGNTQDDNNYNNY